MVVKTKSDTTTKPMRNVSDYSSWQAPMLDSKGSNLFRQPAQDEALQEELTEELITAQELQAIKDQAYTEGFEKGRSEGLDSAQQEIENRTQLLDNLVKQLTEPLQQIGQNTQQELLELAFAISRQILRRELKQDPSQLIAIIREALQLLPVGSTNIQILLHPEDASTVRELLSIDKNSDATRWQLLEEPAMERGGCQIKTHNSKIDASVDRQIAVLFSRVVGGQRAGESDVNG
ncbi:MAG: flagellar assembly protein FliH [Enterobacterales bacterium]|nr:flagellar assembly protein FliH [Enterobacterales bacterium]